MTTSAINYHFKYRQHGQAMVEYAILLVLMVTLIMGGLELSVTVYHSKKTGDAAEAGANAWAEAISRPIQKSKRTELEYQIQLELLRQTLLIDTNENLADRDDDGIAVTIPANGNCSVFPSETCPADEDADEIRPKLGNAGSCLFDHDNDDPDNNGLQSDNVTPASARVYFDPVYFDDVTLPQYSPENPEDNILPIDITSCDTNDAEFINGLRELLLELDVFSDLDLDYSNSDPLQDFFEVCTSRHNDDEIEKIITCRATVDINSDGVDDIDSTFRRLLITKTDTNGNARSLVLDNNLNVNLGDHDTARLDDVDDNVSNQFRHPSCNAIIEGNNVEYDNGLPEDGRIYLFNPLPIDITNCNGNDAARNNSSRVSILVGGHTNNANPNLNVNGLPALNQAIYSQYSRVCVSLAGDLNDPQITIVSCNNFATSATNRIWLKPPGKMCGAVGGTEICPDPDDLEGDADLVMSLRGATGFYFFGNGNVGDRFQYVPSTAANPEFRPAFQLVCNGASHRDFNNDADGACFDGGNNQGSFALEVHTRYRAIFESFLTFGLQELTDANLAAYFYNPNGVGIADNVLIGATGSELGPLGANGRPTVKQFKDFRGCYRVDISPPDKIGEQVKTAVSSCN